MEEAEAPAVAPAIAALVQVVEEADSSQALVVPDPRVFPTPPRLVVQEVALDKADSPAALHTMVSLDWEGRPIPAFQEAYLALAETTRIWLRCAAAAPILERQEAMPM